MIFISCTLFYTEPGWCVKHCFASVTQSYILTNFWTSLPLKMAKIWLQCNSFIAYLTIYTYFNFAKLSQTPAETQWGWVKPSCAVPYTTHSGHSHQKSTRTWNLIYVCFVLLCKESMAWKTTAIKDYPTGRQPHRKTTPQEGNLTGIKNLTGRQS